MYASIHKIIPRKRFSFTFSNADIDEFLSESFKRKILNDTPEQIVQDFGTHVLMDVYIGGKIKTRFTALTRDEDRLRATNYGMNFAFTKAFTIKSDMSLAALNEFKSKFQETNFQVSFEGGVESKFPNTHDILNKDGADGRLNVSEWQNSIEDANSTLVKIGLNGLKPIYDFIADPVKKEAVKLYVEQYLRDNSVKMKNQPVPINHFLSSRSSDSYFTQSDNLPYTMTHQWNNFRYAGTPFYAFDYKAPGTVPVHAIWAPGSDCHRLSTSTAMCCGDVYEGVAFYAYPSAVVNNAVPIHLSTKKLYSQNIKRNKDHYFLTVGENPDGSYTRHGVQFYALTF